MMIEDDQVAQPEKVSNRNYGIQGEKVSTHSEYETPHHL